MVTIDVLPDDVLVEIFTFYVNIYDLYPPLNPWHALVHVCRRWRYLVFASPRRLNLRLAYGGHGPMSEVLDEWPVLPVMLISRLVNSYQRWCNWVAALESEHHNRICEIRISDMTYLRWERVIAAMQKPFPELTHLEVSVYLFVQPVLPDSFLGGSAPRLRNLFLKGIALPSMPKILLSADGLVTLSLFDIPHSGYISPDAMATALTVMTRLKKFDLQFNVRRFLPDPASRPLPPHTRFILPALTELMFGGAYEYLEDLLARIDVPHLYHLHIIFFTDLDFDVPQLHRLIGNVEDFQEFDHAGVLILSSLIQLILYPKTREVDHCTLLKLRIDCRGLDQQLSSLAQVCSSPFPVTGISTLEKLEIRESEYDTSLLCKDDMDNAQWLELLDSFTALKDLYLSHKVAHRVFHALQELSGERAAEVLPALRNLFVRTQSLQSVHQAIRPFVAARRLSGRPVAINLWQG